MNSNSFANSTTSDHDDDTDSQVRGAGKSGRVIEKLMQENDRLRRELRSETAKVRQSILSFFFVTLFLRPGEGRAEKRKATEVAVSHLDFPGKENDK